MSGPNGSVLLRMLGDKELRKHATRVMTSVVELAKESRRAYERARSAERRGETARGAALLAGANAIRVAAATRKAARKE